MSASSGSIGTSQRPRVVVLLSGNGSNLQALIDSQPKLNIVHVLSNRKAAYGLTRASNADIPTSHFALKPFLNAHPTSSREDYDVELAQCVLKWQPDLIVLAGFMHILSPNFLNCFDKSSNGAKTPIINLHPALPGAFDGANAIQRAYDAFQNGQIQHTGVMVHEVVAEVDRGRPILVEQVECVAGESIEALENRIHAVEHVLLVRATQQLCDELQSAKSLSA